MRDLYDDLVWREVNNKSGGNNASCKLLLDANLSTVNLANKLPTERKKETAAMGESER